MDNCHPKIFKTHGTGEFRLEQFKSLGQGVVFEPGILVFHPETISVGNNVYFGHNVILKGYYKNSLEIGDDTWIGQGCFFHSAGGIVIGKAVGVGPMVKILTSQHSARDLGTPVLFTELEFAPVVIGDGADIGINATILPGVTIGEGVIIGAGAIVTRSIPAFTVAVGVPAQVIRDRR